MVVSDAANGQVSKTSSLETLTVKSLKEKCKSQGLSAGGTKADLIKRLGAEADGNPASADNDGGDGKGAEDLESASAVMEDAEMEEARINDAEEEKAEDVTINDVEKKNAEEKDDATINNAEKKEKEGVKMSDVEEEKAEKKEDVPTEEKKEGETEDVPTEEKKKGEKEDVPMEEKKDVPMEEKKEGEKEDVPTQEKEGETEDIPMEEKKEGEKEDVPMEEKKVEEAEADAPMEENDEEKKEEGKILVDIEPSDDEDVEPVRTAAVEYEDFAPDDRPRVSTACGLHDADTTLDAFLGPARNSMTSLCCEGFQYLFCRARTNFGLLGGLYCFELRWLEKSRSSGTVRFGFSPVEYQGLLNDTESLGFTSEGCVFGLGLDGVAGAKFEKGETLAIVVDFQKPSAACISFFINGARACPKIELPGVLKKCLEEKEALYPTFCCKNAAFMINFGASNWTPLPFTVRMMSDAAEEDTQPNPATFVEEPEVLFPIILPEQEATYQAPKGYITCSDETLLDWITKSDNVSGNKGFNVKSLDERAPLLAMLRQLALSRGQNVCIVSENLLESSRKELLLLFSSFRKRAVVHIDRSLEIDAESLRPQFPSYTLPTKEDGFDEISFSNDADKEEEFLKSYIEERKLTERLMPTPSNDFTHAFDGFMKDVRVWMKQQRSVDDTGVVEAENDDNIMELNAFNGGPGGKPLFVFFTEEDWQILHIRFEFTLLLQSFCKDCDRQGFHIKHFHHYYTRYFNKNFKPEDVSLSSYEEVIKAYVPELQINDKQMVALSADAQLDALHILRLVEVKRRERVFRVEAGDEMASISFVSLKNKKHPDSEEKRRDRSRSRYERDERRARHSRSRSRRRRDDRRNVPSRRR